MPKRRPWLKALRRLAFIAGASVLLAGCGPAFEVYRYISLEGYPDARVVERAQAKPGEHRFFVGEIPTRYEIEREGYTLILRIPSKKWGPGLTLAVLPHPEHRVQAHQNPTPCVAWNNYDNSTWWVYNIYPLCFDGDPWKKVDKHLRFEVVDPDGNVVAEEDIPYTIRRDGFFTYLDAI